MWKDFENDRSLETSKVNLLIHSEKFFGVLHSEICDCGSEPWSFDAPSLSFSRCSKHWHSVATCRFMVISAARRAESENP